MSKRMYLKEAADALDISQWTLRMMAKTGEIPCWKSGNRYIFDVEQCEDYLSNKAMENIRPIEPNNNQLGKLRRINAD